MYKKNLHLNVADFQLKKKEKREKKKEEKEKRDPRPAAGFAALTASEFTDFFFGFSHGSDNF
jgi:hypothetical protein